jgi:hypothetical protein
LLEPDRVYGLIVACKAARLSWSTTTMIVRNRPNCPPSTDRELEQCVAVFESLLLSVAQWTIRFGSDRILAKKNELAAAHGGQEGEPACLDVGFADGAKVHRTLLALTPP